MYQDSLKRKHPRGFAASFSALVPQSLIREERSQIRQEAASRPGICLPPLAPKKPYRRVAMAAGGNLMARAHLWIRSAVPQPFPLAFSVIGWLRRGLTARRPCNYTLPLEQSVRCPEFSGQPPLYPRVSLAPISLKFHPRVSPV